MTIRRTAAAVALLALVAACKDEEAAPAAPPANEPPPTVDTKLDFSAVDASLFGGEWRTDGVVVMHEGKIVFEKYANGFDQNKRHITYSVSKSIGSALVGIAIADGLLALDQSVCKYYPAPQGAPADFCDITIDNLVRHTSGKQWVETYDDPSKSNVLTMLYGDEPDMGAYVALQPRAEKPGTKWSYSSGDSNLLARALRGALAGKDMRAWAKEKLFDPAGLKSAFFETDRSGTLVFSSSCFMTVRDMARFGQIYLDDGMIDGKRILPSSWVGFTHTPAPPVATPRARVAGQPPGESGGSYGAAFWLNAASPTASPDTFAYPQMPADAYAAEGHWGQKIFIVPSKKLVVARTGDDRAKTFDPGPMVEAAIKAVSR